MSLSGPSPRDSRWYSTRDAGCSAAARLNAPCKTKNQRPLTGSSPVQGTLFYLGQKKSTPPDGVEKGIQANRDRNPNTPLEASHMMMPLVTTPREMAQKAGRSFICSRVAMRQPVQAPVPGRGIATKR